VNPEALLPLAVVVIIYVAAYAGDPGRIFHPMRGMRWADALRLAGLPDWRPARTEHDLMPLALPVGAMVAVYGDLFPPAGWVGPALGISAGVIAAMGLVALLGPPAPARRPMTLSYPRRSRLRVRRGDVHPVALPAGAPDADSGPEEREFGPDGLVLFHIAPRDARPYSRPGCEPPGSFMNSMVLAVEELRPRFAWLQVAWARGPGVARELRWMRTEMDYDLRSRTGKGLPADVWNAVEAAVAGGALVVSARGALLGVGEDAVLTLPAGRCSDDFDHLVALPSREPGLLAAMVARDPLVRAYERAVRSHRSAPELPGWLATPEQVAMYAALPSIGPFEWAPRLGIPAIAAWGASAEDLRVAPPARLRAVPRVEELEENDLAYLAAVAADRGAVDIIMRADSGEVQLTGPTWAFERVYGELDLEPTDPRDPARELLAMLLEGEAAARATMGG
jgi:hypothetical protein